MNRREARRIAIHRAGLIIEAVLNDGWQPDDLIEREGQDAFEMINDELTKIAESMIDGRPPRAPQQRPAEGHKGLALALAARAEPRQSVATSLARMMENLREAHLHFSRRLCLHPGAVARWVHPADSAAVGYWERRCDHCGAWAQARYGVPALLPMLRPADEQTGDTAGSNTEQEETTP